MKTYQPSPKKKRPLLPTLLLLGILTCIIVLTVSLYTFYRPFTMEDILYFAGSVRSGIVHQFESLSDTIASWSDTSEPSAPPKEEDSHPPYIEFTGEEGDVAHLEAQGTDPPDQVYLYMLDTQLGPMLYYHQGDIRWGDYLYGGEDPMHSYGCGPTAAAMVINSFGNTAVDPTDIADWASENGYYALHGGSYHSLIPDSLNAYGLHVESVTDRSREHVAELLSSGHILVALMGRGTLTNNGHFVLFTNLLESGNISIADPVNYENCTLEWNLDQLLSELKKSYDNGGPLWAVSPAES